MKCNLIIDKNKEESIVITAHEKNDLVLEILKLIEKDDVNLLGYTEDEIVPINLKEVYAFYTNKGKVYAMVNDKNYVIRQRLYNLLEVLDDSFLKINQGCIINCKKIAKFQSSVAGSIKVVLKNGFSDYISRRELANVKRRVGL